MLFRSSSFPKNIAMLRALSGTATVRARLLSAANEINDEQRRWVVRALRSQLKTLFGRRVGLLGLSYKPKTDDVRNSPALEIASELALSGVQVRAFDPIVTRVPSPLDDMIELVSTPMEAASGADALVLATDWDGFASLPLDDLRAVMRVPLLLDGRNCIDQEAARAAGFVYVGVGRGQGKILPFRQSQSQEGLGSLVPTQRAPRRLPRPVPHRPARSSRFAAHRPEHQW